MLVLGPVIGYASNALGTLAGQGGQAALGLAMVGAGAYSTYSAVSSNSTQVMATILGAITTALGAYTLARGFAQGGMGRTQQPGAASMPAPKGTPSPPGEGRYVVSPGSVDEALSELSRVGEGIGFKGLPRQVVEISPRDLPGRSGETHCGWFSCYKVVVDPVMSDRAELFATLWHEARHFNAGFLERNFMSATAHMRLHFWDIELANAVRANDLSSFSVPLQHGQVDFCVPHPIERFVP